MKDWIRIMLSPGSRLNIPKEDHHKFQIFAAVVCDLLWSYQNRVYHINQVSLEHFTAWKNLSQGPVEEKWVLPPPTRFKINFDTTIRESYSAQATVCRNYSRQIIQMKSQINNKYLPNMGEALAAQLAVSLAISLNIKKFITE
jgi:hypothetical protein